MTYAEAAEQAGVSVRTIERRMSEPVFRAELDRLQDDALEQAVSRLGAGASRAVERLLLMLRPGVPAHVQLGAARTLLANAVTLRRDELDELARRVEALERGGA
jgi:hypothetical protein